MKTTLIPILLIAALLAVVPAPASADPCVDEYAACFQSVFSEYMSCLGSGGSNCNAMFAFQLEVCIMIYEWCQEDA